MKVGCWVRAQAGFLPSCIGALVFSEMTRKEGWWDVRLGGRPGRPQGAGQALGTALREKKIWRKEKEEGLEGEMKEGKKEREKRGRKKMIKRI